MDKHTEDFFNVALGGKPLAVDSVKRSEPKKQPAGKGILGQLQSINISLPKIKIGGVRKGVQKGVGESAKTIEGTTPVVRAPENSQSVQEKKEIAPPPPKPELAAKVSGEVIKTLEPEVPKENLALELPEEHLPAVQALAALVPKDQENQNPPRPSAQ